MTGVAAAAQISNPAVDRCFGADRRRSVDGGGGVRFRVQPIGYGKADLHKECYELANNPDAELEELTEIYRRRGLSDPLATEVAKA